MIWYQNLYVGESIKKKAQKVKWKIRHNAGQIDIYVVALATNGVDLLEIISSCELMQKHYPKSDLWIVGLAKGYEEALEIVEQIVSQVYAETGETDVQSYIRQRFQVVKER